MLTTNLAPKTAAKHLLRRLHAKLPDTVRYEIDIASISLQDTLHNWHMPAYYVRSSLPDSNGEGTVLYFGDRPQYKSWTHTLFGHTIQPVSLGQFSLFQILGGRHPELTADIMLCPLNPWTMPLFAQRNWHIMPSYVDCHVDLRKPINELITSKDAKGDLRVARRFDYRFENVENDQALHEFFYKMLLPTVKSRYKERAFLPKFENIQHIYQNGVLIAAYLDDEWVGAHLLDIEGTDSIRSANLGWRNGADEWRKKGLIASLYNQTFIWAQENGFIKLNMGSSQPFVNDGPLNFKLKWGATMMPLEVRFVEGQVEGARSFIGAKFDLKSLAAQYFLTTTPLLDCIDGKLRAISWNAEIPPQFRRHISLGCEWVNLANTCGAESSI